MSDKRSQGIELRYEVKKLTNPGKELDCLVLEFDDPIARVGITAWADEMFRQGYFKIAAQIYSKLVRYEESGL